MENLTEKYIELVKQLIEYCPNDISEYGDGEICCYYNHDEVTYTISSDGKQVKVAAYTLKQFVIDNERFAQSVQWVLRDWKNQVQINNYTMFESFVESFIPPKSEFDSLVSE